MAIYGGFCKEPVTSCKALYNSNLIDEGVTDVALQTPKGGMMVKATCVVENGNVHTHVRCDGLTGGRGCRDHISVRADNTCTDAGYFVTPFRNQKHYAAAFKAWGKDLILKYYRTVGGVYHAGNGRNWARGTYSQCTPFASTSSCANGFQSVDGGAWWITDRKNRGEPSGDYNVSNSATICFPKENCFFFFSLKRPRGERMNAMCITTMFLFLFLCRGFIFILLALPPFFKAFNTRVSSILCIPTVTARTHFFASCLLSKKKALDYLETRALNNGQNEIVSDDELAQVGFSQVNDNTAYQVKSGEYYMCGLAEY